MGSICSDNSHIHINMYYKEILSQILSNDWRWWFSKFSADSKPCSPVVALSFSCLSCTILSKCPCWCQGPSSSIVTQLCLLSTIRPCNMWLKWLIGFDKGEDYDSDQEATCDCCRTEWQLQGIPDQNGQKLWRKIRGEISWAKTWKLDQPRRSDGVCGICVFSRAEGSIENNGKQRQMWLIFNGAEEV